MLSYRRETALQVCVIVFAKSRRLELGDNILRTLARSIFNHCDIIGLKICRIRWIKTQNKGNYGVQGHSNSSRSVRIDSPYAISYWHPISYRFGVIAAYCSNFGHFAFLSHRLGGLGTTYHVHVGLIGKRIIDFLYC